MTGLTRGRVRERPVSHRVAEHGPFDVRGELRRRDGHGRRGA